LSSRQAISDAVQAETLSIVAFEAGMFGWMALVYFVLFTNPHINPDHAGYWLMMQIAASIGLATSYPVNTWLVRHGITHAMETPTSAAAAAALREGRSPAHRSDL
jgi:hypothetical protein